MGKDQDLLEAARSGNVAVVEKILKAKRSGPLASLRRGPGANVQDSSGYSCLHHAALNGHKEIVKLFLDHDASPNLVDNKGSTPLHLASWSGNVDIVKLLLHSMCSVHLTTKDDETALHCAAQYGHTEVVSLLLEHGCAPGVKNIRGETALDLAAQYGRLVTVELLIRMYPSLIHPMQRGFRGMIFPHTPLHLASRNGHKAVVEVLLCSGFDVNIRTKAGTALHEAALCGKVEVVRTLLDHGADVSIRDSHDFTVTDLLSQFPAQATHEIMSILKRYRRRPHRQVADSDGESVSQPFPLVPNVDSDLGSPYENVRPSSKNSRTMAADPSPSSSPQVWELQRCRPPEAFDDRRVSGTSGNSMESDSGSYNLPYPPQVFRDSEDSHYLSARDADQISLSSTASSTGYPRRPDSGGAPLYMPMNSAKGGHSPGSNNKVSPTPPKKPPRRNLSVSPTHLPQSDGVSNNAYEYLFFAHSGARSQGNLTDVSDSETRRLSHGRSVDQYVEMSTFSIPLDEDETRANKELHRGKSEDLDSRRHEPVAITTVYENVVVRQQNPHRRLRRNPDVYEEYDFRKKESPDASAPEPTFVSSAFIMVSDGGERADSVGSAGGRGVGLVSYPLSPTHYQQPPTPEHPPPSAHQAENFIHDRIRPLSQEYKRRSKDMETETEEEYLFVYEESSGSFSSSVSLSDRSVDNILEEYNSETPYAGLIKGSSRVLETLTNNTQPLERPKSLKKLKRVYETANGDASKDDAQKSSSSGSDKEAENKENREQRMSVLSPFDEQEEWAKIQEIMASFGTGLVRESVFVAELEKEFQSRLRNLSFSQGSLNNESLSSVEKWLQSLEMGEYSGLFISNGFDDLNFLNGVLEEIDLKEIGIASELERQLILDSCKHLPFKINDQSIANNNFSETDTVDNWLKRIHLEQYSETFAKHLYHDMGRIRRIWDVELSAVLDIEKIGHRKRILASVSNGEHITSGPKLEDINADLNFLLKAELKSPSIHSVNSSNTGTIRHRHKKSRPAPPPPTNSSREEDSDSKQSAELSVGGSNSIKSHWKHQPILLITGCVKYSANYLGSTCIKEFKGTESTKKSIRKVRKSGERSCEEIVLSISYRGVKFINPVLQATICEHEIRNINCACQDTEDLAYFAYITKDLNNYYCHVFFTVSPDQATDIILTLGQAFELAYQMALREQVTSKSKANRDNHKPMVSPRAVSSNSRDFRDSSSATRTDLKLNGHPLKMKSLTLSLAAEPAPETQRTPTKVNCSDAEG